MMTRAELEQMERDFADFADRYGRRPVKRARGRPTTGITDAMYLAIQVEEHRQAGLTRAQAVRKVEELTRKSAAHISLCHSMAEENDLDKIEKKRERMANRARERKSYAGKKVSWAEALARERRQVKE
jgi:hypothetical protein